MCWGHVGLVFTDVAALGGREVKRVNAICMTIWASITCFGFPSLSYIQAIFDCNFCTTTTTTTTRLLKGFTSWIATEEPTILQATLKNQNAMNHRLFCGPLM